MTARSSFLGVLALLSAACAGAPKQVVEVARTDLACAQVSITEVGDNRYAASGCGRGGVYAQMCQDQQGCSWVRLRGANEVANEYATSGGVSQPAPTSEPRQIIAAPPPAQREVIAAPPPAQREIIAAPPPANNTPAQQGAAGQDSQGSGSSTQSFTPQPTPLSQGELSTPYEAEVPVEPIVQRVEVPPPAPLLEQPPPPPVRSYVWVDGYWWWNTPRWVWVSGYWCPPRVGYAYVRGSWYWSNNYWWYGPGGWARPGGTYIVHRLPPRPHRVTTVRDFSPHRATSTASARVVGSGNGLSRAPSYSGRSAAPAPRSFSPQGSPVYRYPSSVAPSNRSLGTVGGSRMSAPSVAPQNRSYGTAGSRMSSPGYVERPSPASRPKRFESGLGNSPGRSFSAPSQMSAPRAAPAPRSFSTGRSGGGGMSAPQRAPSSVPRGAPLGRGR
jgi:hypothetical protein